MPSTRRRLSRQEKQAQTRVRLLRSAELVFAERGFFAASLDEIAARAGFSIGAVYSNFESKGDLFLALFEEHAAGQVRDYLELFAAGRRLADPDAVPDELFGSVLALFFDALAGAARANPDAGPQPRATRSRSEARE